MRRTDADGRVRRRNKHVGVVKEVRGDRKLDLFWASEWMYSGGQKSTPLLVQLNWAYDKQNVNV